MQKNIDLIKKLNQHVQQIKKADTSLLEQIKENFPDYIESVFSYRAVTHISMNEFKLVKNTIVGSSWSTSLEGIKYFLNLKGLKQNDKIIIHQALIEGFNIKKLALDLENKNGLTLINHALKEDEIVLFKFIKNKALPQEILIKELYR